MKSLLLSLGLLFIVALGAGSTLAAFRNPEPSTGNSFQAGNLDILISGKDNSGNIFNTRYFNVTNMKPGDTATAYIEVASPAASNNLQALYRMYLDNVWQTPSNFAGQLQVEVTHNPFPYTPSYSGTIEGPLNELVYSGPLTGILGTGTPINNINRTYVQGLGFDNGDLSIYRVTVTMPSALGNAWQGASFTGRIVVESSQFAGQSQGNVIFGDTKLYDLKWVSHATPTNLNFGQTIGVPMTITNTGSLTWPKDGPNPVHITYHWYNASWQIVEWGIGLRSDLPSDVASGQTVILTASLKAPTTAGTYNLLWDGVHEGVTWFSAKGIDTLSVSSITIQ